MAGEAPGTRAVLLNASNSGPLYRRVLRKAEVVIGYQTDQFAAIHFYDRPAARCGHQPVIQLSFAV
jgi:hypothetical protein